MMLAESPLVRWNSAPFVSTALAVSALTGHIIDSKKQKIDAQQLANSSV